MKFRCLKLLLVVSSLALSACSLFNKKSSSENTSSEEKRPPRENFFERIPYYEVKSGVNPDLLEGAPWIDSNLPGMTNRIKQPSLKDDFYASVNYDALCKNEPGPFDESNYAVAEQMNNIMLNNTDATNSKLIKRAREFMIDGAASSIKSYYDALDMSTYLNSGELFYADSSLFEIYQDGDRYIINYNDGYLFGNSGWNTILFYANYYDQFQTTRDQLYTELLSDFDMTLTKGYESLDLDTSYGVNMYTSFAYAGYQVTYSQYTIGGSGSYSFMDNALADIGLDSLDSIYISNPTKSIMDSFMNYYTDDISVLKDMVIMRMLFEYRFCAGVDSYRRISKIIGDSGLFYQEKDVSYMDDDYVARRMMLIGLPKFMERAYIQLYGDPEVKQQVTEIIGQVLQGYKDLANELDWLDNKTRTGLSEKLNLMKSVSCYSDKIKNYPAAYEEGCSTWGLLRVAQEYSKMSFNIGMQGLLETDYFWSYMPSYTVNAFYSTGSNEFVILNGLLGGGGFTGGTIEETLAGVGMVIGHEISHAFDKNGSQYDAHGQQNNWWSAKCKKAFNEKVNKVIDFFDQIELFDDQYANGELVNTEATADMGGVQVCLQIAKGIENFDYDLFFRTYARTWLSEAYDDRTVEYYLQDQHPFDYLRCNVTLCQFEEFVQTYDIQEGDGMYLPPEERIAIW